MFDPHSQNKSIEEQDIVELESLLQSTLRPVPPRHSYEGELRRRLGNHSAPSLEYPPEIRTLGLFGVLAGLLFGMALVLVAIKAFVTLGGMQWVSAIRRKLR